MIKDYKIFLKKYISKINNLKINDELDGKKYLKIYKLFLEIKDEIDNSINLNFNDLNKMLIDDNKLDDNLKQFKKFIKIKNEYIINKVLKSNIFTNYLEKLYNQKYKDEKDKDKIITILKRNFKNLFNKYINNINGIWEIVDFEDNKIKKIELIEPEHVQFIYKKLDL